MFAMWLEGIVLIIATEALVELWKKAAPLQDFKGWLIDKTPFLYSERMDTHLLECPYCMSVWIGFIVVSLYLIADIFLYLFMALAVHRLSNYIHLLSSFIRDKQLDIRAGRAR